MNVIMQRRQMASDVFCPQARSEIELRDGNVIHGAAWNNVQANGFTVRLADTVYVSRVLPLLLIRSFVCSFVLRSD